MTVEVEVGTVGVECPDCQQVIDVHVTAHVATEEDGRQVLVCNPDMADLWAHSWTHLGGSA